MVSSVGRFVVSSFRRFVVSSVGRFVGWSVGRWVNGRSLYRFGLDFRTTAFSNEESQPEGRLAFEHAAAAMRPRAHEGFVQKS